MIHSISISPTDDAYSVSSSTNNLARVFSIMMRQIGSLLSVALKTINRSTNVTGSPELQLTHSGLCELLTHTDMVLQPIWDWLMTVMDTTEAQLRYFT